MYQMTCVQACSQAWQVLIIAAAITRQKPCKDDQPSPREEMHAFERVRVPLLGVISLIAMT